MFIWDVNGKAKAQSQEAVLCRLAPADLLPTEGELGFEGPDEGSASEVLRPRSDPFYPVVMRRILKFLGVGAPRAGGKFE